MNQSIEIVGGGLAGLSLAIALQRRGVPVTVFESGTYPRHRVCGEFISGLDSTTVEQLGLGEVLSDALRHKRVSWYRAGYEFAAQTLPAPALGISRHILDERLAEIFVSAGGTLLTRTRVNPFETVPGRIVATGRKRGPSPWIGLKAHVRGLQTTEDLEMHLGGRAYVGLTRVAADEVNLCGLFHRRAVGSNTDPNEPHRGQATLLDYLSGCGFPDLRDRLARAEIQAGSVCAVAGLTFAPSAAPSGAIAIGDAYRMIPPFTGNGMAIAFQSAAMALEPVLRFTQGKQCWTDAVTETNRRLQGRFARRFASANLIHPFLLQAPRQRWVVALGRSRLLPFRLFYAALR